MNLSIRASWVTALVVATLTHGPHPGTDIHSDLDHSYGVHHQPGQVSPEGASGISHHSTGGPRYTLQIQCSLATEGGNCYNPMTCTRPDGSLGHLYTVLADGRPVGQTCLAPSQAPAATTPTLTPAMVLAAFRRLSWPSAVLTLQPPDHRTLVNLPTIFSTSLHTRQTRTVTLIGLRVTIEATPVGYTWRPGDGSSWTTDDAGTPYRTGADVATLNTHTYRHSGHLSPAVDVRYHGRYHVAGGPWTDIPQERTIAGAGQALTVVQAEGLLTGS